MVSSVRIRLVARLVDESADSHRPCQGQYLRAAKTLPLNVKFIIEGEEEIGSRNLGRFLEQYQEKMAADFIVLTDTKNYDVGHPALVYQLRGICQVEVQGLHQPLHSSSSGPVPDPVQILCAMIADLRKKDGALNVPGLYAKVARPSAKQLARIRKLPLSEAKFKKDAGLLPGVRLWGERQFSLLESQWTRPALTVIALEARPFLGSTNQIIDAARARLSLRTVPGMDAREAGRLIVGKDEGQPRRGRHPVGTAGLPADLRHRRVRPGRPQEALGVPLRNSRSPPGRGTASRAPP
jgi:acetylornithine deacetylase/succinyl-diaminopimelate desuccinylase-like protein